MKELTPEIKAALTADFNRSGSPNYPRPDSPTDKNATASSPGTDWEYNRGD